ncbi:MAG: hypothetical protein ACOCUV_01585 [bacterium]
MNIFKIKKKSQDFQGYFTGEVPDYAINILGTPMVDASQIKSMFSKVDDAINLVNRFDSSLLKDVSFIFNFSKSGAYGVYLPSLDWAIKNKALQKKMEQMGYEVNIDEQGLITARHTIDQKTPEQIQQDIDRIKQSIEAQGGSAFGINMQDVLNSARMDAKQSQSEDPNLWEWMALLHLGATIVHEAVHAKGEESEGPSSHQESKFIEWALPIINQEYEQSLRTQGKEEMYAPLQISGQTRHANGNSWYKKAQTMSYAPPEHFNNSKFDRPSGSDLSGRFPYGPQTDQGMSGWAMIMQEDQSIPMEKRLDRRFMFPIPSDLDQGNDIYDEQLRKSREGAWELDTQASLEELLSGGHDENRGYLTMEELLEEKRPKPLIVPIKKKASSSDLIKISTVFGWYNNLEISDGSTIPGLSDRIMSWDWADEAFKEREREIRNQPRYNPTYDIKGFYYRYIEPRFQPRLFSDIQKDVTNTAPAKRFASNTETEKDKNKKLLQIVSVLSSIRRKLRKGKIKSTRLVMSEDVVHLVNSLFRSSVFKIIYYPLDKTPMGEMVFAVWICVLDVPDEKVEKAEKYIRNGEGSKNLVEELIGYTSQHKSVIDVIINETKEICKNYGIKDVYLVGGYPRDLILEGHEANVEDLDFSGAWSNQSIKVGGLLAEELGVSNVNLYHRTMTLSFEYKGVKIDFRGNFSPAEIRKQLRKRGIPTTPLNMDIYNRDFTINMLLYDILKQEIRDITGESLRDLKKGIIRTILDADFVCRENPIVILRALKFKLRYGFEIDSELHKAMKKYGYKLFDGTYSEDRLIVGRLNVERENRKGAKALFEEYNIEKIMEI